jgi:hypothetical protein
MDILLLFHSLPDLFMEVINGEVFNRISFYHGMLLINFHPLQILHSEMASSIILYLLDCFLHIESVTAWYYDVYVW